MKVLHISGFKDRGLRTGGIRRSLQIREILAKAPDLQCHRMHFDDEPSLRSLASLGNVVAGSMWLRHPGLTAAGRLKSLWITQQLRQALREHTPDRIVLEAGPSATLLAGLQLVEWRIPYLYVPHNIEALVPGQRLRPFKAEHGVFSVERDLYRSATCCHAISDLDRAVIRCLGGEAKTLPYFPPRDEVQRFRSIAEARHSATQDLYLVLGTALNAPTRNGLLAAATALSASNRGNVRVVVAGFGTESLRGLVPSTVDVQGGIPDAQLDQLLIAARALVVSQPQTTGFMTRMVEMNLAGLPTVVLGDYLQARGLEAHGIFSWPIEALSRIEQIGAEGVQQFDFPQDAVSAFLDDIRRPCQ